MTEAQISKLVSESMSRPQAGVELVRELGVTRAELLQAAAAQPYRMSEYWLDMACDRLDASRRDVWKFVPRAGGANGAAASWREPASIGASIASWLGLELPSGLWHDAIERVRAGKHVPYELSSRAAAAPAGLRHFHDVGAALATVRALHRGKSALDLGEMVRVKGVLDIACVRGLQRPPRERTEGAAEGSIELVWGMLYRAMRLDFDLLVASGRYSETRWVEVTRRRFGAVDASWIESILKQPPTSGLEVAALLASRAARADAGAFLLDEAPLDVRALLAPPADPLSRDERTDIPNKVSAIDVAICNVGASKVEIPVTYLDPCTNTPTVATCGITVTARLPGTRRGVHMSRFQEAAMRLTQQRWNDLGAAADAMAADALERQGAEEAEVALSAQVFLRKLTDATHRETMLPARVEHRSRLLPDGRNRSFSISLGVMTACPCTLAYSKLKAARDVSSVLDVSPQVVHDLLPPTFTHSQPGTVKVAVRSRGELPTLLDLFEALNSSAHLVESVLKRPDEHALVERSHSKPQFCEDLARSVSVAVAALCDPTDEVSVTVELDESIHPHRAFAELRDEAGKLWQAARALQSAHA